MGCAGNLPRHSGHCLGRLGCHGGRLLLLLLLLLLFDLSRVVEPKVDMGEALPKHVQPVFTTSSIITHGCVVLLVLVLSQPLVAVLTDAVAVLAEVKLAPSEEKIVC